MAGRGTDVRQLLLQVDASVELAKRNLNDLARVVQADSAKMDASLASIDGSTNRVGMAFGKLSAGASALGVSLGAGAFLAAGRAILSFADDLDAAASQAGMGVERFQTLQEALRSLEIPAEKADKIFKTLQATLGDVQNGADNAATKAIERLGITADVMSGKISSSDQLLDALAGAAKNAGSQAQFTADMVDIFGKKIGVDLAAAIADGGTALHKLEEDMRATGTVIDEEMIKKLADANETIDRFVERSKRQFTIWAADVIDAFEKAGYRIDQFQKKLAEMSPLGRPEAFDASIEEHERANIEELLQTQKWRVAEAKGALQAAQNARARGGISGNFGAGSDPSIGQRASTLRKEAEELERLTKLYESMAASRRQAAKADEAATRITPRTNETDKKDEIAFLNPVDGRVSSGFGPRKAPKAGASTFHPGIDFAVPLGTPVKAPAMGVVEIVGFDAGLGKYVVIDHGGGTKTKFGHLGSASVKAGQMVSSGEVFARSGNTGISTGPHLDYRVMVGGKYVDPRTGKFRADIGAAYAAAERAPVATEPTLAELRDKAAELYSPQVQDILAGLDFTKPVADLEQVNGTLLDLPGLMNNIDASIPELAEMLPIEDQRRIEQFSQDLKRDLAAGLADAIVYGENLGDVLVNSFQRAAAAMLESGILDLLSGGKQGTSFGSFFSSFLGGGKGAGGGGEIGWPDVASMLGQVEASNPPAFGGWRAEGGPVVPGKWYLTGERGPEPFIPKVPGTILPSGGGRGNGEILRIEVDRSDYFDVRVKRISAQTAAPMADRAAEIGSIDAQSSIAWKSDRQLPMGG